MKRSSIKKAWDRIVQSVQRTPGNGLLGSLTGSLWP